MRPEQCYYAARAYVVCFNISSMPKHQRGLLILVVSVKIITETGYIPITALVGGFLVIRANITKVT